MPRPDIAPDEVDSSGAMLNGAIPANAMLDIDAVAVPAGFSPWLGSLAAQIAEENDGVGHASPPRR